jgi:TPR repeat protein
VPETKGGEVAFPDRLRTNFELVKQVPSNKPFGVFLVKDKTQDLRLCVLRLLPDSLSGNKDFVDAFMAYFSKFSEIINRAYISSVYSISGQPGGNVYVLEEHVPGIDLPTFIKTNSGNAGLSKEIIGIVGKACEALHHAHQKDVFHLAITPEDILIDEKTGRVKLVGFGVHVFAQANKIGLLSAQARKTIAPEVLTGSSFRPRADVYSLVKAIDHVCPEVFSGSDVLSMALLENPSDRYQQARDFEGALNVALEDINKAARSRNIYTHVESNGRLKPILTEKPVKAERDVYQPPPRMPHTHQPQPPIKPDSVPVMPEPDRPKSISMKLVAAIACGSIVAIVMLILYVYQGKQKETNQIKEAARVAAIEKEKRETEQVTAKRKEAQKQANLYKERLEKEKREKELELERIKKEQQELPAFAWSYPEDVKNLLRRAIKGEVYAQFGMGLKYSKGDGIPKDEGEALKWFQKASDQGYAKAQIELGLMYSNGRGISRNYSEAVKWYRKAAEQGAAEAQSDLGLMYYRGWGVGKDYSAAAGWFRKAADQGFAKAQFNVAVCYENGDGVSKDYLEAVKWYRRAADRGDAEAQSDLGLMYYNGRGVSKNYSEAVRWFRFAADQGFAKAQYNLGVCYENGDGVSKDYLEAVKWYRKAADQGDADAQSDLGLTYYHGRGVSKNYSEAWTWFKKSADSGNASAQNSLGLMYAEGHGVTKDYSQAVIWYKLAADQGDASAQFNLGNMYFDEKGVAKNYSEALKWFRKAAAQDNQVAKDKLKELGLKP